MAKVNVLSKDVINKIAAGEIVERPVSVLKELLDNSLDAKANNITIEVEQGGIGLIKVIDNGVGMTQEDAQNAMKRHATSKIKSIDDLLNIRTMGFRGEALSSISSVSRFSLQTKPTGQLEGFEVSANGNSSFSTQTVACPEGTTVTIKDLFFNIPVRRKFLKSVNTEYNHILDLFINYALSNYEKGFKLIYNGKTIYNLPAQNGWMGRIKALLSKEIADNLVNIEANQWEVKVNGFVGTPGIYRQNRKHQFLFINDRVVNDYIIARAVKEAFSHLIPRDGFPVYVLKINLDPTLVDANIHPRKSEVRFVYPDIVYRSVYKAVNGALNEKNLLTSLNLPVSDKTNFNNTENKPIDVKSSSSFNFTQPQRTVSPQDSLAFYRVMNQSSPSVEPTSEQSQPVSIDQPVFWGSERSYRILGQLHKAYIVCETPQGMLLIDQHAAAESLLYEELKKNLAQDGKKSQKLLLAQKLELSYKEKQLLKNHLKYFNDIGFEIIDEDDNYSIVSVPSSLQGYEIKQLFLGIMDDLDNEEVSEEMSLKDKQERVIKYASCRGAVKFNDKLELAEVEKLVRDIFTQRVYSCPHGRPVMIELSMDKLGNYFKRV